MNDHDKVRTLAGRAASAKTSRPGPATKVAKLIDGRLERSVVTRKKIVDAATALVYEGHVAPTAQQVSERAGIGLRTVFRHFDDMESLYREFSNRFDAEIEPLMQTRLSGSTGQERLIQSIDIRAGLYERMGPLLISCQVSRHTSPYLAQRRMYWAQLEREMIKHMLPPAVVGNAPLVEALCMAMSFEAWTRLRREQLLDTKRAKEVMRLLVRALLAGAGSNA